MTFTLIIQAYLTKYPERNEELFAALKKNYANPLIKTIVLMSERDAYKQYLAAVKNDSNRVHHIVMAKRCKYSDMLYQANNRYRSSVVILANTDVYFDKTLECISTINMNNKFLAITRLDPNPLDDTQWELFGQDHSQTQDAWIFKPPVKIAIDTELGKPGCENLFAQAAVNAKMQVLNPALSVRVFHIHNTNIRSWVEQKDRVRGKYFFPPVCYINGEVPPVLDYQI